MSRTNAKELLTEADGLLGAASPHPWSSLAEQGCRWNVVDANGEPVALAEQRINALRGRDVERDANAALLIRAPGLIADLSAALADALHQAQTWEPLARERLDRIRELEAERDAALKQVADWDILAQDRADEIRKLRDQLAKFSEQIEDPPKALESPVKMCGGVHAGGLSGYLGRNRP